MKAIQRIFIDKTHTIPQTIDTINTCLRNVYDALLSPPTLVTVFGGNRLAQIADPVVGDDAATKRYVDRAIQTIKIAKPTSSQSSSKFGLISNFGQQLTTGTATEYGSIYGALLVVATNSYRIGWRAMEAFALSTMVVETADAQPASGSMVITLQVNGADSGLVATVAANAAAGTFTAAAGVSVAVGDNLRFKLVNNASALSATIMSVGVL